ncbi:MAG: hypothetical protein GWP19_13270, partial [Planctomycetia bacterium]|nr:hypothetical protein [Planctomycetia bacterium]
MSSHLIKTVISLSLFLSQIFSQVIITEVMYDPDTKDSEFVELFNTSNNTVDLTGWTIGDEKDADLLKEKDAGDGLKLKPLGYAVILEDDYTGIYDSMIPSNALLTKIDDGNIGYRGLAQSDAVYLKDSADTLIDSYGWADPAPDNFSIEKVWLDQPNTPDNWKPSRNPLGTPGAPNSVAPLNIDGKISNNIIFTPRYPKPGESVIVTVTVENTGVQNIGGIVSATFNNKIIGFANSPVLSSRATATINIPLNLLPSGRHEITFQFSVDNDDNFTNNTKVKKLGVAFDPGTVTINEFLSNPGDNQIEFIELVSSK